MKRFLLLSACTAAASTVASAMPYDYGQWLARLDQQPGHPVNAVGAAAATSPITIAQNTTNMERAGSPGKVLDTGAEKSFRSNSDIELYPGEVKVLPMSKVDRVAIGNGSVVSATIVDDKQIVLLGETAGRTTLHLWLKNGQQRTFEVKVAGTNLTEQATKELKQILAAEPTILVSSVNDKVVLTGSYSSVDSAARIKAMLGMYPQVVNLVTDKPSNYMVPKEKMVLMEVKVIEARKQALDELGIKWNRSINGPTVGADWVFYSNSQSRPSYIAADANNNPIATMARPFLSFVGLASQITSALNFLENNGDIWTLAEPRVSTINGGKSKVRVGGDIPIPVSTGLGQVSVIYKEYGVILEIEPLIDDNGNIRSKIVAEVSRPDQSGGTGDYVSFITNRTETDVSLTEGESLVISGLLLNEGTRSDENVPGLSKLPLFGRLFSNRYFKNDRTEMLVVVTPRLHVPGSDRAKELEDSALKKVQQIEKNIDQRVKD